jgi:hypothetical protein
MKIIQGSYLQGYIFSFFTLEERTKTHHIYLFLVQDLPDDPTGELDKVQKFVEENLDICKWVALSVVVLEVLGLFFATVLQAVSASTQRDYAIDEDYLAASSSRQPVANRQPIQAATPNSTPGAPSEARSPKNDAWSTRMRDKVLES